MAFLKAHIRPLCSIKVHDEATAPYRSESNAQMVVRQELAKRGVKRWNDLDSKSQVDILRVVTRQSSLVILPGGPFMGKWDMCMMVALLYTVLVTPFEVAFTTPAGPNGFFWVNRAVDVAFLVDMYVQCFLAFQEVGKTLQPVWVTDLCAIRRHYLRSWFCLDFLGIMASAIDICSLLLESQGMPPMQSVRIIRVARLVKLFRTLKSSRIYSRWFASLEVRYAHLELMVYCVGVLTAAHFGACLWGLVAQLEKSAGMASWVDFAAQTKRNRLDVDNPVEVYVVALYWSLMTISTVGYGDIAPQSMAEYVVATLWMLLGGGIWAFVIGATCTAAGQLDAERISHGQRMDAVILMSRDRNLPRDLRQRLRSYFQQSRRMHRMAMYSEVTEYMSPALRGEVALSVTRRYLLQIPFLARAEDDLVSAVAKMLTLQSFSPNESIAPERDIEVEDGLAVPPLTIMESGLAWRRVVLCPGSVWHLDTLLLRYPFLRDPLLAVSLSFVVVYTISRKAFHEVMIRYGDANSRKRLRMASVKLGLQRMLQRAAKMLGDEPTICSLAEAVEILMRRANTHAQTHLASADVPKISGNSNTDTHHAGPQSVSVGRVGGAFDAGRCGPAAKEPPNADQTAAAQTSPLCVIVSGGQGERAGNEEVGMECTEVEEKEAESFLRAATGDLSALTGRVAAVEVRLGTIEELLRNINRHFAAQSDGASTARPRTGTRTAPSATAPVAAPWASVPGAVAQPGVFQGSLPPTW